MSPSKGRPFSTNPKDTMFRVRLDKETIDKLDTCAAALNTSKSEVIRIGIEKVHDEIKQK
jgi:predicted transcriptional regulator